MWGGAGNDVEDSVFGRGLDPRLDVGRTRVLSRLTGFSPANTAGELLLSAGKTNHTIHRFGDDLISLRNKTAVRREPSPPDEGQTVPPPPFDFLTRTDYQNVCKIVKLILVYPQ
jgi:hypothetical protein